MKKEYIVELREEEAEELMDEHWVGELVRCKDCVKRPEEHGTELNGKLYRHCELHMRWTTDDWFCADGEEKEEK